MNDAVKEFGKRALAAEDIRSKDVLEVGSYNVNGSLSDWVNEHSPASYVKTDSRPGPDVDKVLDVCDALAEYGPDSFDLVFSTETLEHVEDWLVAVENMKQMVRPCGVVVLTARAPGATRHDHPGDYWRFSCDAMSRIFGDWTVELLEPDPGALKSPCKAGAFVKARKPEGPYNPITIEAGWVEPAP